MRKSLPRDDLNARTPAWLAGDCSRLLAIVATLIALGILSCAPRITQQESHQGRMYLAGFAILLLVAGGVFARNPHLISEPRRARLVAAWKALWVSAAILGVGNYFQFDARLATTIRDHGDITYYYLNSKYFSELSYTNLYRAMLVADAEGDQTFKQVREYRDLAGYKEFHSRNRALREGAQIRGLFSHERWASFQADVTTITRQDQGHGWRYFFQDHGYNPPPSWTLVGGALANSVDVSHLKWIANLDIVLMGAAFLGITWAFSPTVALICLVFFCSTFSGRWPLVGQALLRFDWVAAYVLSVVFLKKERPALAGACLMYATCVRVFPGVFAIPVVAYFVRDCMRARRIPDAHLKFAGGALLAALILLVGAALQYGVSSFGESFVNLKLHASPESFSSHRVGLGDALLYRGEFSERDFRAAGGIGPKREQLWELSPYLQGVGIVSIVAIFLVSLRSKAPLYRLLWLGVVPLFIMTNPQINYYNLRIVLVALHAERLRDSRHLTGLLLLFAIEFLSQGAKVLHATRYAVTAITSVGMLVYLTVMFTLFLFEEKDKARAVADS